jgi:L,D-transpeptidase catalytic domain
MRTDRVSYSATAIRPLIAKRALNQRAGSHFGTRNVNGAPMVFGVLGARLNRQCRVTHYKVQLPLRPNGATGWVRAADVRVRVVRTRILIDLSQRRITLFRSGQVAFLTTAAIGARSTPTPIGQFYVNQRLLSSNPIGDFGPGAVGISAFSPVLVSWPQGGPIAIHGTSDPGLIGSAVSHGCLRVRNVDAERFLREAVEGTPVEIRA